MKYLCLGINVSCALIDFGFGLHSLRAGHYGLAAYDFALFVFCAALAVLIANRRST